MTLICVLQSSRDTLNEKCVCSSTLSLQGLPIPCSFDVLFQNFKTSTVYMSQASTNYSLLPTLPSGD